jgi:acetyltransferase-like isoleucine patch superfamily enzyme
MKYIKYTFLAVYNILRLSIKRLIHFGKLKFEFIQLISPKVSIELEGPNAKLTLKRVEILAGTTLKASGGKIIIGFNVFINKNCMIVAQKRIEIGDGTTIGPNVVIYDHDHIFGRNKNNQKELFRRDNVLIGRNVWIGAGVIILKNTTIGDNCVIGAGTIVSGQVPENTLVIQDRNLKFISIE